MPVLSVPRGRAVPHLLLSVRFSLPGPIVQTGPPDVVEVGSRQAGDGSVYGISHLIGVSDHDHLRGEVHVRFSAPPSDVVEQNPHDGCHHLHRHSHDTGHLYDLSSQGINSFALVLD